MLTGTVVEHKLVYSRYANKEDKGKVTTTINLLIGNEDNTFVVEGKLGELGDIVEITARVLDKAQAELVRSARK